MPRLKEYNEGQSFTATFRFFDSGYVPASPATVRYRIDCLTTGNAIRDWTTLTPAQALSISVTPEDNVIKEPINRYERRQLVVQSNYGTSTQSVQSSDWLVKNLQGVT